jgi:hypothetical protein
VGTAKVSTAATGASLRGRFTITSPAGVATMGLDVEVRKVTHEAELAVLYPGHCAATSQPPATADLTFDPAQYGHYLTCVNGTLANGDRYSVGPDVTDWIGANLLVNVLRPDGTMVSLGFYANKAVGNPDILAISPAQAVAIADGGAWRVG